MNVILFNDIIENEDHIVKRSIRIENNYDKKLLISMTLIIIRLIDTQKCKFNY